MKSNMKMIQRVLRQAADTRRNALLVGEHGTGKTTIVKTIFDEVFGPKNWVYFSASTMDPFIDFIGCPKEQHNDELNKPVLDLIRPLRFAGDGPKAIFMDEFNRSHKKVRNAVMELIQFGSINDKPFPNLQCVWAAINPEDQEYDVEALDGAQKDRFHLQIQFPSAPDEDYFSQFGKDLARSVIQWHSELPKDIKKSVSPRRLEYAIRAHQDKMDLEYFLPPEANISSLRNFMRSTPIMDELSKLTTADEKRAFFKDENNFLTAKEIIVNGENVFDYVPYWPKEKICAEVVNEDFIFNVAFEAFENKGTPESDIIYDVLGEIIKANHNKEVCAVLREALGLDENGEIV